MNQKQFMDLITKNIVVNRSFNNPSGKGITQIKVNDGKTITYQRGHSRISITILELWNVYQKFLNNTISTRDLKKYKPYIYNSNNKGHSCNSTALFLIFQNIGIISKINGRGVKGDPFWIEL